MAQRPFYMPHMAFRGPNDCHRLVYCFPQVLNLDSDEPELKVRFILLGEIQDTLRLFRISGMTVYKGFAEKDVFKGDSLVQRISGTTPIDSIDFPIIPDGFEFQPSQLKPKKLIPVANLIDKNSDYFFTFSTPESCYHGEWQYDARYSLPEHRWLFSEQGMFDPPLGASYENWRKNDHIEIILPERKQISEQSFKVLDSSGNTVSYELVTNRNPTYTILLNLERDLNAYDKFTLLISNTIIDATTEHSDFYSLPLNVGGKGTVGIGGKYNFLEK